MSDEVINDVVEESAEVVEDSGVENEVELAEEGSEEISDDSSEHEGGEAVEVQAESEEELEQEIEQAIEDGASEEEVKSMVRQFVLKVDGKEFTKEIDLGDEEAVRAELQKAYKGQITMQEKAEQEQLFKQFLDGVQDDPFKLIKQINPDFDEIAYASSFFDKLLKDNEMSPEDKAANERELKYQEAIERADRLEKEADQRTRDEENAKLTANFKSSIEEALTADSELNVNPTTIGRVAHHMHKAALKGIDLEPKQVLDSVKKEIRAQFQSSAGMLKDQNLLSKYMGDDLSEALRRTRVEQAAKKVPSTSSIASVSKKVAKKAEEKPKINLSDLMKGRV